MKSVSTLTAATILVAMATSLRAEPQPPAESRPSRLVLDLVDGSHIIGVPSIKSIPVQTSYTKMDIPLKKIQSIEIEEAGERVYIALKNGDSFSGVLGLRKFEMTALFGKVTIGIEHLNRIQVFQVSSLPAGIKRGLVLHYSFDKEEKERVNDESGKGNHGKVHGAKWTSSGKVMGAYELDGKDDYISLGDRQIIDDSKGFAVCLWFKTVRKDKTVILRLKGSRSELIVSMLPAASTHPVYFGFRHHREIVSREAKYGIDRLRNEWHRMILVYNGEDKNNKASYALYIDGDSVPLTTARTIGGSSNANEIGRNSPPHAHFAGTIDEVMIWNRALSESEIKQLYAFQK